MAYVLLQIGIVYFLGHVFNFSFRKFRIPDILLFTIIGLILGPITHVAKPDDFGAAGPVLSTLALIVILFESGTTLDFKKAAEASGLSLLITLTTMLVTGTLIYLLTWPLTQSSQISLLIGVIAAGTSSAVVIPMVDVLNLNEKLKNVLILESALSDVLCIVLTLTLSQSLLSGEFSTKAFVEQILLSFLVAIAIGTAIGLFWSKVRHMLNAQFATVAVALIVYGLTELLGYSGPIAVMSFGVFLTQAPRLLKNTPLTPLTELESSFYRELVFVFKVFFFIFLGISISIESAGPVVLAITIMSITIAARFILVRLMAGRSGTSTELTYTSLLIPKGLAAAVLAGVPVQMGLAGGEIIQSYVYSIVLVSIVLVSVLIPLTQVPQLQFLLKRFFSKSL